MELIHEIVRYRCFADAVCHHARGTQTVWRSIFRTLSKAITLGDYFPDRLQESIREDRVQILQELTE